MQVLAFQEGGSVENEGKKEFGYAQVSLQNKSSLFSNLDKKLDVWMSHGDKVTSLPDGYERVAVSDNSPIAAFENSEKKYFGLQFHPEVTLQDGTEHSKYRVRDAPLRQSAHSEYWR